LGGVVEGDRLKEVRIGALPDDERLAQILRSRLSATTVPLAVRTAAAPLITTSSLTDAEYKESTVETKSNPTRAVQKESKCGIGLRKRLETTSAAKVTRIQPPTHIGE
jgi:hypothetical protein